MKTIIYIILLSLFFVDLSAQDSLKKPFFMKPYSVSIQAGYWGYSPYQFMRLSDYQQMAPSNEIVKRYDKSYASGYYGDQPGNTFGVSANAGFIFYNKNKKKYNNRYELKLAFHFQNQSIEEMNLTKDERIRFDTLKAFHSNEMYLVDTMKFMRLSYSYSKTLYAGGAEFLFHTLQNRIVSAYIGIGTTYGITTENTIHADYYQSEWFQDQYGTVYHYADGPNAHLKKSETTYLKNGQMAMAYIPIGGILRFSNIKKGYVRRFALNAELKGGVRWEQLMQRSVVGGLFSANIGLKIFLHREVFQKGFKAPHPFY